MTDVADDVDLTASDATNGVLVKAAPGHEPLVDLMEAAPALSPLPDCAQNQAGEHCGDDEKRDRHGLDERHGQTLIRSSTVVHMKLTLLSWEANQSRDPLGRPICEHPTIDIIEVATFSIAASEVLCGNCGENLGTINHG